MVQTGVHRAFGAQLRAFLQHTLRSPARALLAGFGVTALLQSSTATGLMVTGFADEGLVELTPALAAMLGANVGTTLIVQLVTSHVAELAPVLILLGVALFRWCRARRTRPCEALGLADMVQTMLEGLRRKARALPWTRQGAVAPWIPHT